MTAVFVSGNGDRGAPIDDHHMSYCSKYANNQKGASCGS
jgi:hypothetical protein